MGAEMTGQVSLERTADEIADKWTGFYKFEVGTGVEYAAYMEFGTRPHGITPNTAPALHFWVDGTEVFTDFVDHPGTEPRPYMRPGAEAAARETAAIAPEATDLEDFTETLSDLVQQHAKRLVPVDTGKLKVSIRVWQVA